MRAINVMRITLDFSLLENGVKHMERKKTGINVVMLDWTQIYMDGSMRNDTPITKRTFSAHILVLKIQFSGRRNQGSLAGFTVRAVQINNNPGVSFCARS